MISLSTLYSHPIRSLIILSISIHLLTTLLLALSPSLLPSFDSSSSLLVSARLEPFLRWDTVYFASIALHGYQHEQQLAFMPGLPGLMRVGGGLVAWLTGAKELGTDHVVVAGACMAMVAGIAAVVTLYQYVPRPRYRPTRADPHLPPLPQPHPLPLTFPPLLRAPRLPPLPPLSLSSDPAFGSLYRTLLGPLYLSRHAPLDEEEAVPCGRGLGVGDDVQGARNGAWCGVLWVGVGD